MQTGDTGPAARGVPACAKCAVKDKACRSPEGQAPPFCPSAIDPGSLAWARKQYADPGVSEFARQASIQEGECYVGRGVRPYVLHPVKTRIQETTEFARRMGYRRLGVAFCAGLHAEARTLADILEAQGFDVVSVVCKVGATPKEAIGLLDGEKVRVGVGLCVGHDSLFLKYSNALCTVLVAKDRVLAHAPAAALHTAGSYSPWLKAPGR